MIGVFDSGVGGLTVLKELRKEFPKADFLYFGDTARVPYGTRSPDVIKRYAKEIAGYLVRKGAKVIVVACNTVSANAMRELEREFPEVPFLGVIEPAVKEATSVTRGVVGVVGTSATVKSHAYRDSLTALNPEIRVFEEACPLLVPLVEFGWQDHVIAKKVVRYYTRYFRDSRVDTLILGCTHFPVLIDTFKSVMRKSVKVIHSGEACAKALRELLKEKGLESEANESSETHYFCTDDENCFVEFDKMLSGGLKPSAVKVVPFEDLA